MKVFIRNRMLALLLLATMLCTMLPTMVFANEDPILLYGLADGVVVDASKIIFGVSGITEAPTVTMDGNAIATNKVTYANGVVTVDATGDDIAFGSNSMTVTASQADGGAAIFTGNVVLEKFGASVNADYTVTALTRSSNETMSYTKSTDGTYFDLNFNANSGGGNTWMFATGTASSNFRDARKYGAFDISVKASVDKNTKIDMQVFRNPNNDPTSTAGTVFDSASTIISGGYFGGKYQQEFAVPETSTIYTLRVQIDTNAKKFRLWVTPEGGTEIFVNETALTDNIETYGFNHARLRIFNGSPSTAPVATTMKLYTNVGFTYKNQDPLSVESVTSGDRTLTADESGEYQLLTVDNNLEITLNKNITGTVTLGSATATVSDSNTIVFNNLSLESGNYDLVIPASATTTGAVTLGNKEVLPFRVVNEFATLSPLEDATYTIDEDIFSINSAGKTVSYVLNGVDCADKAALSANLKLGRNVLEVYAKDASETSAERINFNVTDTQIYNPENYSGSGLGVNNATNITMKETINGVENTFIRARPTADNIQINLPQRMSVLRDQSSGTNFDNRFLSGKAVWEMDVRFEDASKASFSYIFRSSGIPQLVKAGAYTINGTETRLANNTWYTFKLVMDMVNKKVEFYINSDCIYTYQPNQTTDYLTNDANALVQMKYVTTDKTKYIDLDTDNVKYYFEVPAALEGVTYGESKTAVTSGIIPEDTTAFGITTSLRIPDSEITIKNVQLLVDGKNVATAVAKDTTDANYLGAGVEMNAGTTTTYYIENGATVYKPLWMGGTKGTKLNLTAAPQKGGTKGTLVIKAGTKVVATDWKYTTSDDNGSNIQKLTVLENDVIFPVYFSKNGIYSEISKASREDALRTLIMTDGTQAKTTLVQYIAEYVATGLGDADVKYYNIEAGNVFTVLNSADFDASNAISAKGMLWEKDSLTPLADYVILK